MINNISKRDLPTKQNLKNNNTRYKELYLQCKKNVAIFMKHVDSELTIIFKNHQQEKNRLRDQIQSLKNQLQKQNSISTNYSKPTGFRNTQSQVSGQNIDENLGYFSHLNFKTFCSQSKNQSELNCLQNKAKSKQTIQSQKQNIILPANVNEDLQIDIKIMNLSKRDQRLRERRPREKIQKVENIKDFLKDIRGKLNTERPTSQTKQKDGYTINIITPQMFTARSTK